jgi:anthranilate phosphoribosyltransferase
VTDPIRGALATVAGGEALDADAAEAFMAAVLDGEVTPAQLGGLLLAIRVRGEQAEELTGFVRAMRSRAVAVGAPEGTIDICGTGGDIHSTFNVSTAASIVTAAAGVPIAKAGNRAVSSASGSSDVMAALGLTVEQGADEAEASLRDEGYAYLHAPAFHPGMRHAGPVRMELGVRTAFNLIGPIANPARPRRQLMGVPDGNAAQKAAATLQALGSERAFVVTGDRIDELPLDDSGVILDVSPTGIERVPVSAAEHGLPRAPTDELRGGDAVENAALIEAILEGRERGPRRDVVVLNAAAAILVAGTAIDLRDGVARAGEAIDSGAASALLARLRSRARARARAPATGAR